MKDNIDKLAALFKQFPGVGERQARRFVLSLIERSPVFRAELSDHIKNISKEIRQCIDCFRYFQNDGNEKCSICGNIGADQTILMVVEKDADIDTVSNTGSFLGVFFVLGALIPISEEKILARTRIDKLLARIARDNDLEEIILGFPMNATGDNTDLYIRSAINAAKKEKVIKVTSLGRGLSTGTELEYIDSETLKNALKNRQ